jgi:hypothetical protein
LPKWKPLSNVVGGAENVPPVTLLSIVIIPPKLATVLASKQWHRSLQGHMTIGGGRFTGGLI